MDEKGVYGPIEHCEVIDGKTVWADGFDGTDALCTAACVTEGRRRT